ncbi:uncharacterized protein N7511_001524 [Penicillium nucicola]|uniref:uncharacterized protein n=1 Tax=Penicillium nucicola TaxID=1850975 RepID=UPI0025452477|nr:uncharacterized protein N7511_001524 [Penicillium nucicola]KAJ5776513.1 hypothetical protein N7511_001524 [Penicillium nucicola]
MALESLAPEILLIILEHVFSPLDMIAAINASPNLYRSYIAYKQHLQENILTRAIHPTCRADAYTALDVQNIQRQITSGTKITKLKAECFSIFVTDRKRRSRNHGVFKVDDDKLETLFNLQASTERLIDTFCHWSLRNLFSKDHDHPPLPPSTTIPRANLSYTEQARLQRAFYRCEVFARFHRVLQLQDKSSAMNFIQIVMSFGSQFRQHEFEEIVCIRQFLAKCVESLCETLEDDFTTFCSKKSLLDAGVERKPDHKYDTLIEKDNTGTPLSKTFKDCGLFLFTNEYRSTPYHDNHVKYLVSCGPAYILSLNNLPPRDLRDVLVKSQRYSNDLDVNDYFVTGTMIDENIDKISRKSFYYGKVVSIDRDEVDSHNLGWEWGTSFDTDVKPDSPSNAILRDMGYVFWDVGRLVDSGLVIEPYVVALGTEFFPPGFKRAFSRPSVEERLFGWKLDTNVLREWRGV